jgi:hypothetical protein
MSVKSIKPVGKRRNKEEYIKRNSKYKLADGVTLFYQLECEKVLSQIEQVEEQVKIEKIRKNVSNAIFLLQLEGD